MADEHFDPGSRLEEEGVPDLQDGTPTQQLAEDPNELPDVGAERPGASVDWGTTPAEEEQGEPLLSRLSREEPDLDPGPLDEGLPESAESPAVDVTGTGEEPYDAAEAPPEHAGRLIAQDEGVHPDTEKDSTATEAGADGGGFLPEEQAMRIEEQP